MGCIDFMFRALLVFCISEEAAIRNMVGEVTCCWGFSRPQGQPEGLAYHSHFWKCEPIELCLARRRQRRHLFATENRSRWPCSIHLRPGLDGTQNTELAGLSAAKCSTIPCPSLHRCHVLRRRQHWRSKHHRLGGSIALLPRGKSEKRQGS
jgi:hypothetical protein